MSYLSLLLASTMQGMANLARRGRDTEAEVHAAADAFEWAWAGLGGEADDYRLPSGIASLEHWLDLNA